MQRHKYSYRKLFETFRKAYPAIRKQVLYWEPCDFSTLKLFFKDGRVAMYNDYDHQIKFLDEIWMREEPSRREVRHKQHDENTAIFSTNFKKLMKETEITQKEVAETLGISKQSVSAYANGKRYPNKECRIHIAHILGVKADQLTTYYKNEEDE